LIPLLASAVLLLAGAVGGAWYLGMLPFGGERHAEATAGVPEDHGEDGHGGGGGHGKEKLGPLVPFDSFIANLADDDANRYLKATFQIEFLGAAPPEDLNENLPQIRDLLLTLLTSKTFQEVRTPEGKQELREEIIARVNQVLERDAVKAVYFTEFIVQ
jgi:flagellar FliL protein